MTATRRWFARMAWLAVLTVLLGAVTEITGSGTGGRSTPSPAPGPPGPVSPAPASPTPEGSQQPQPETRVLGDGSTAFTGAQPNQPTPRKLEPGQKPPQFVVLSWDGAAENGYRLFSRFRKLAAKYDASMTYFLSGLYLLPEEERHRYHPPGHAPGASDILFLDDEDIRATLEQLRLAWLDGSEIGTHFNGHFCGPGGVGSWSVQDWKSEIRQAKWFVQHWKTTTGFKDMPPLPFDYDQELIGGRTPCLEGRENLLPAAEQMGFRYDSSGTGYQVWPGKEGGLWDLPLQQIPMPGRSFETLSMDYNFLANQSGTVNGDPAMHDHWQQQWHDGLMQGFRRAYQGNRAPMIIGNHFEQWNDGIYMDGLAEFIKTVCPKKDVRCVSFRQLVDWLDVQNPDVLARLRTLAVGEKPQKGWDDFLAKPTVRKDGGRTADDKGPKKKQASGARPSAAPQAAPSDA